MVVGSLLIALLRHADRVRIVCLAQAAAYGRGEVLHVWVDSPTYTTRRHGEVPLLHATAVRAADGSLTVFAVNRGRRAPLPLELTAGGVG